MKKETKELTKHEVQVIENQISTLHPTQVIMENQNVSVSHVLVLTMVDGKVCFNLTGVSSQRCLICNVGPKDMNKNCEPCNNTLRVQHYSFDLSPLHCRIRFMECVLHISYWLEIKKWQAKTPEEKESVQRRKTFIQDKFFQNVGIKVDQTKQGTGNTNDGNTARRFFSNIHCTSDITGINLNLLLNFQKILNILTSKNRLILTILEY